MAYRTVAAPSHAYLPSVSGQPHCSCARLHAEIPPRARRRSRACQLFSSAVSRCWCASTVISTRLRPLAAVHGTPLPHHHHHHHRRRRLDRPSPQAPQPSPPAHHARPSCPAPLAGPASAPAPPPRPLRGPRCCVRAPNPLHLPHTQQRRASQRDAAQRQHVRIRVHVHVHAHARTCACVCAHTHTHTPAPAPGAQAQEGLFPAHLQCAGLGRCSHRRWGYLEALRCPAPASAAPPRPVQEDHCCAWLRLGVDQLPQAP